MNGFKQSQGAPSIFLSFASLRETLFRFLENKTGGPAFLAMLAHPCVGDPVVDVSGIEERD